MTDTPTINQRDPFAGIADRIPTRYAPGDTMTPYHYPDENAWHAVIYYFAGEVEAGEGRIWLVEPYPAARADGTDGLDPVDSAGVAVLRGTAAPHPRGADPDGDWVIPGKALRENYAYDVHIGNQRDLMAAWCEAWAIATALNNGVVDAFGLKPNDIDVLLAAERVGDLLGDSRFAGTINELRWRPVGDRFSGERVPAAQAKRLRNGLRAIEAVTTREVSPDYGRELSTAGRPWTETTYGLTRAGAEMLDSIRQQYDGPARCRMCGCTENRACPGGCGWVPDPELGDLCSRCPTGNVDELGMAR